MEDFYLYTPWDLQEKFRIFLLTRRKLLKKSRRVLSEQTGVPAPTIRRFEQTGEISLKQFTVLWWALSDEAELIDFINSLEKAKKMPKSFKELLKDDY